MKATELVEYGIHDEQSDIRAHVSPLDETIYVFPTINGIQAVEWYSPPLVDAKQPGVNGITARGWLVRPFWIIELREIHFQWRWWQHYKDDFSTDRKGRYAVACVRACMRAGYFPIWFDAKEDNDRNVQIAGTDLLIFCHKRIQVKCDTPSARTGNLFLQQAECNPRKLY